MSIKIQSANSSDVTPILALVNHYAEANITLPRTEESVRSTLDDWVIALDTIVDSEESRTTSQKAEMGQNFSGGLVDPLHNASNFVGCGALVPLTDQLVEIRSLAIAKGQQGKGVGRLLVNELVQMARERGFTQVCALTLTEDFFVKLGFHLVDRWSISPKVWQACIYCPKFHRCDEVAVLMHLHQPSENTKKRNDGWNGLLKYNAWQPLKLAYQEKPKTENKL